jgi:hypothetical protein
MKIAWVVRVFGSQWMVACPFCNELHLHSAVSGVRVPHCVDWEPGKPQYDVQEP